jgi:hypothetical protein
MIRLKKQIFNFSKYSSILILFCLITGIINSYKAEAFDSSTNSKAVNGIYKVNTSKLRIRKEASINSPVVGTLSKDTLVYSQLDWTIKEKNKVYNPDKTDIVDGKAGTWINVCLDNVRESAGYIFTGYLLDVTDKYTAHFHATFSSYCALSDAQNLVCTDEQDNKRKSNFSLKNIQKVIYATQDCSYKQVINEYKNYNEIKSGFNISNKYWIIIVENITKLPVQIIHTETGYECEE